MSWEATLLSFFSWNFIWFGQKQPIKVQNFRLLTAHVKFYQICTFIGSFCWKYIKFQPKKYRGVMSHDTEDDATFEEKLICCFKNDKNLVNFDPVSKICTLTGSFCAKYKTFDIKKYRGVILHDTEEWCKISRKTDLWFGKWLGIWQIFTRALESVKIENLVGSFCPKWKMHELKIYRGVMCNYTEQWWKTWRGIDLSLQNWHEEFDKFWPKHSEVSKICALMGYFWPN